MSLADRLAEAKKKLAETEKPQTQTNLALDEPLCSNSEDYLRMMRETYIEEYYSVIEPYTFRSEFFSVEC